MKTSRWKEKSIHVLLLDESIINVPRHRQHIRNDQCSCPGSIWIWIPFVPPRTDLRTVSTVRLTHVLIQSSRCFNTLIQLRRKEYLRNMSSKEGWTTTKLVIFASDAAPNQIPSAFSEADMIRIPFDLNLTCL